MINATMHVIKSSRLYVLALIVLTILIIEGFSFWAGIYLQSYGVFYNKPIIADDYPEYLATLDPVLGWPAPNTFGQDGKRDVKGSRIIPLFPDPLSYSSCIALYGDSFTWSSEVDHAHAWSNILSGFLQCRVANYGVGGYGTDQAYLRFLHNEKDVTPIVILNHLSENILRNVNQFRYLLYPSTGKGFKPRFIVDDRLQLKHIRLPGFSQTEFVSALTSPQEYLPYEYFAPGASSGVQKLRFPFSFSLIRAFDHFRVRAKLFGREPYEEFYQANHEAGGLEVTVEIMKAFVEQARQQGKVPILTILPIGSDLRKYIREGRWTYQPLLDALDKQEIEVLNVGMDMVAGLNGQDPCLLFNDCDAHYNELGYAEVARIVYNYLKSKELPASMRYNL